MSKEELLRIYSAYLPYKVLVTDDEYEDGYSQTYELAGVTSDDDGALVYDNIDSSIESFNINYLKLNLWSMDMLTQPIEHKGETFVPLHKILEAYCFDLSKMDEEYILSFAESLIEIDMSLKTATMLLEWHFNIFNLPDSAYIKKENLKK